MVTPDMIRDDRGKYPIKIIPLHEKYYVYYEDKLYTQGDWDFIKGEVEDLKTYYDVGIFLRWTLPESTFSECRLHTIEDNEIRG